MNAVLELKSVAKAFGGRPAVENLSLALAPGEIYTLLGPNGAGKTTTLNLILGFERADAGDITVSGCSVASDPLSARAKTAYLPETVMLHPTLTAIESLRYFSLLSGRKLTVMDAARLLSEAGLQSAAHEQRTGTFSKGMRQKVGVAIALAKQAQVLLLDEPTSGLDARAANELSNLVHAVSQRGIAVLMTTHDLYRVTDMADRLGILSAGSLIAERDAKSLTPHELETLYLEQLPS